MSSATPKFGSFKPKPKSKAQDTQPVRPVTRVDEAERIGEARSPHSGNLARLSYRHRDGLHADPGGDRGSSRTDRHSHRDREQRREPHEERHRQGRKAQTNSATAVDESEKSDVYIVDRRGDAQNVEYGSLHRYSIAGYHRTGYGRVIGRPDVKINRVESTDKHIVLDRPERVHSDLQQRPLSSRHGLKSDRRFRLLVPSEVKNTTEVSADFISLALHSGRKRKLDSESGESPFPAEVDYRSIAGKAKAEQLLDDADVTDAKDSDNDTKADRPAVAARRENAELIKATKDQPRNVLVWTALVDHQSHLIRSDASCDRLSHAEKRTLADIRISIYNKALANITSNSDGYESLVLDMLDEGTLLWESSKLMSKWQDVLSRHPGSIALWTKYLDHAQTSHSSFRFEQCKEVYLECLGVLVKARKSASDAEISAIYSVQTYVLLRFTNFLRDTGYDELGYAIWQALLEFHFFRPANSCDVSEALQMLEEFWDSEVPRIGERRAKGWACTVNEGTRETRTARMAVRKPVPDVPKECNIQRPLLDESLAMENLQLPATDDNDVDMDDPFCYIMFSDLRKIIELLTESPPAETLISAFLSFCGLPPLPGSSTSSSSWQSDQFVASTKSPEAIQTMNISITTWELFTTTFTGFSNCAANIDFVEFAERVLAMIVTARLDDEQLAEYFLAFKLAFRSSEGNKDEIAMAAKTLLELKPSSLCLYNAYALIEAKRGRVEKAAKVWSMAIEMGGGLGHEEQDNCILLWHGWMRTSLESSDGDCDALEVLLALVDDNPDRVKSSKPVTIDVSASQRLKATRHFEAGFGRMTWEKKFDVAVLYADCHMWFEYLANDRALDSVVESQSKYSTRLEKATARNVAQERLLQAQAHVIIHHLDHHRPYKPATLRLEVAESLHRYPDNSLFISLYLRLSTGTRIDDRLRASMQEDDILTGPKAGIVGWTFAIQEELRRCNIEAAGSTENSVRSTFARALSFPHSRVYHSLALWRQWLNFELPSRGGKMTPPRLLSEPQRKQALDRAKQVFLDGLRALPWCKAWVVQGLKILGNEGGMEKEEMRVVWRLLEERELRVRFAFVAGHSRDF
ncbi:hypothetical protein LTR62_001050 [Meristemomyces frigidus]|uniref:DUF1740-domain-containing protein n=1 Tax=Meristemomyces frigidus TaxID=1508187 RepID=A0AAN7T9L5_9PEZI|nr:hypothetical protein LTR62_001050 [Meristemomyces frigidus]